MHYYEEGRQVNGHDTHAYYVWVDNPANHFRVLYPSPRDDPSLCQGYLKPSLMAQEQNCLFATNGGPFTMYQLPGNPTCLGNIVSDGNVVQAQNTTNANFGITTDGKYVMGEMDDSDVQTLPLEQLVTGFGWLVREGVNKVTSTGGEIAPRTAIGTDKQGRLLLFVCNGVEKQDIGLTMAQLSSWLLDLNVYSAVNLDGGGSSVAVLNGTIVNHPTCSDTVKECERWVTTMTCIMA